MIALHGSAQQGDELLVYAVKGNVTALYKNEETAVKIGRVLFPGTVIKTQKESSLTMLCKKGRAVNLTKEGNFPVNLWKDSCRVTSASITSNYFTYIWNQFYTYSPEYKEAMRKRSELAVTRGDETYRYKAPPKNRIRISFGPGMDTVNYGGGRFPLSWTCFDYNGRYVFMLFDARGSRIIYQDSIWENYIPLEHLAPYLETGKSYKWTITAPKAGFIKKRVLNIVPAEKITAYRDSLLQPISPAEDSASRFFRVGFMLEKKHYLAEALKCYQQAALAEPEIEAYRDYFIRFRNDYWIR